jgi:serine/threonine protein kinase
MKSEHTRSGEHEVGPLSAEGAGRASCDEPTRQAADPPASPSRRAWTRWCEGTHLLDGRFTVKRLLGQGGMGVVYEADDRERRARVALKTLPFMDAAAIYRLKQEFRALAGVRHPNLVGLHELFCDDGEWFFTMDLVKGLPLSDYLGEEPEEALLKRAFGELAAGIRAIHAAGKLHRDLKPTNVMVTREHRVVLMDFGLASDQESGGAGQTVTEEGVSGTPFYMAPEQAASQAASCASDWYAFGVMLFEALTGVGPFRGTSLAVLLQKQQEDAPRASSLREGIAEDLDQLCAALLDRRPEVRPSYEAIVRVLGEIPPASDVPKRPRSLFVGREAELDAMASACKTADDGRTVVLFVHGPSGIGKSALVEQFLERLEEQRCAVMFAGRCYEQESLPYKACDSLIDALSRYLRMLPRERASGLLPRQVHDCRWCATGSSGSRCRRIRRRCNKKPSWL